MCLSLKKIICILLVLNSRILIRFTCYKLLTHLMNNDVKGNSNTTLTRGTFIGVFTSSQMWECPAKRRIGFVWNHTSSKRHKMAKAQTKPSRKEERGSCLLPLFWKGKTTHTLNNRNIKKGVLETYRLLCLKWFRLPHLPVAEYRQNLKRYAIRNSVGGFTFKFFVMIYKNTAIVTRDILIQRRIY